MSKVICIMGESGSGKTTSMRNLDPSTTFYIDCDKKGLSWKGWRSQYNTDNKNYWQTDSQKLVFSIFKKVNSEKQYRDFKTIVVDTLNGIMVADEVRRMKEKGYDKWADLAQCVWSVIEGAYSLRDDLTVIFVCHSQTQKEDDGYTFTRIKTSGKKLDKLSIESKMTTVLYASSKGGKYVFETRANNSTTKTPLGAFEESEIPNDIVPVLEALKDY